MEESKSATATDNTINDAAVNSISATSPTTITRISRPPVATSRTSTGLPNVLVTHIAQSYLSQESALNQHGYPHHHRREAIPFALTCRHWCRVLSASYRWYTPLRYHLVCDMKTMRLHVVDHEWQYDYDFDQIDRHSLASWPLSDGIEKQYPPNHSVNPSMPSWLELPPRQMKSKKKVQKKKVQSRVSRFITHAQRVQRQGEQVAVVTVTVDSSSTAGKLSNNGSVTVTPSTLASTGTDILVDEEESSDTESEFGASVSSPSSAFSFRPGPIGRHVRREIHVLRYYSHHAPLSYREKYGCIPTYEAERQFQFIDLSWLPVQCEKLVLDRRVTLPSLPMTQFARLHTIVIGDVRSIDLKRTAEQWPPHLTTLQFEYIEGHHDYPIVDIAPPPEEVRFPPTVTNLHLPHILFSSEMYQSNPELIPWPAGLQRLWYDGPRDMRNVVFPSSLTDLTLSSYETMSVDGWHMPSNLKRVLFCDFNQPLAGLKWPPSLESLETGQHWNQSLLASQLPQTLTELTIRSYYFTQPPSQVVFPPQLTSLTFQWAWQPRAGVEEPIMTIAFPNSLTQLHLHKFPLPLASIPLPSLLTDLSIGSVTHSIEDVILPEGLKRLQFGHEFNESVEKLILPQQLESLTFGSSFNQPVAGLKLPPSLRKLTMGGFDQSIRGWHFPDSLLVLDLGWSFTKPLTGVRLPPRLCEFHLSRNFSHVSSLMKLILPRSLRRMTLIDPEELRKMPTYQRYCEYTQKLKNEIQLQLRTNGAYRTM